MACVNCGKPTESGVYICEKCVEDSILRHNLGSSLAISSSTINEINLNGSIMIGIESHMTPESLNILDISDSELQLSEELLFDFNDISEDQGKMLLKSYVRMLRNMGLPLDIEEKSLPILTSGDLTIAEKITKCSEKIEGQFPELSELDLNLLLGSLNYALSQIRTGVITVAGKKYHLDKAQEYLDKALNIEAKSLPAHKNKVKMLLEKGEYQEAIECLNWILDHLELSTDDLSVFLNKGIALYKTDNPDEAVDYFDMVLDEDPSNVEAWRRKGDVFANTDRWGGAIQCYNEAIKHDPSREDIWIDMAKLYIEYGKYKDASSRLDEVLKKNISNSNAWYLQGIVFSKVGRWGAAVQCLDKALNVDPLHIKSLKAKGDLLSGSKRYDEAFDCYERALTLWPDNNTLLHSKLKLLKSAKRYNEALESLEKTLANHENNADAWFEMGDILQEIGKVYKALKSFDKALEIRPSFVEAYYRKGITLEKLRRYKEAIRCYEEALKLDPKFEKAERAKKDCKRKIDKK